jgi:hypothetical protein
VIRPKVKVTDTGKEDAKKVRDRLKTLGKAYVTIGVHDDAGKYSEGNPPPDVVEVALWMEYGTETIPERSFIRSTVDENVSKINQWREEAVRKIIFERLSVEKALESIGIKVQFLIQNKIKSNVPPPLAPSTKAAKQRKGVAPVTLIDTGLLLRSITYKVHT